jgi:hypothetical protein
MAENIDISQFTDALSQLTRATEESYLAQMGYTRNSAGLLSKLEKNEKTRAEIEDKLTKELISTYGKQKIYADKNQALYKQQLSNLGYVVNEAGKIAKAMGSVELTVAQQRQIARLSELDKKQKETIEAQVNLGRNLKQGAVDFGKSMAGFASELASGNTSFSTLNPVIDAVAGALSNLASAIPLVGSFLSAGIKAAAEGAKFILELAQKNIKVFQDLSSGGAIFSNGMSGVNKMFDQAGMTMEGFSNVIKQNGETLSRYGGTIAGGAAKFTDAVGKLTKPGDSPLAKAGLELRNLGLTADDIGERAAAFLEQEIRLGRGRSLNADQLAKGTAAYTKELLALQKITGKSREELESERKQILNRGRFRATTDEMRAQGFGGGAESALRFMQRLPEELRAGFEETLSGAGGQEFGKLVATFGQDIIPFVEAFKTAKTTEEGIAAEDRLAKKISELSVSAAERFRGVATVTGETGFTSFAVLSDLANKGLPDFAKAVADVNNAAKTTDDTTKNAVKAQQQLEEASRKLFAAGTGALPLATAAVNEFAIVLNKAIGAAEDLFGVSGTTSPSVPGPTSLGNTNTRPGSGRDKAARANAEAGRLSPGQDPLARLNFGGKRSERTGGGDATPALIEKANMLNDLFPGGIFTALNDLHPRVNPAHREGRALDFVFNPTDAPKTPEEADILKKQIKELGFSTVLDEYFRDVKPGTTGKHFHAEVSAKYGGIASGPQTGFPAMLHGPKEAIIPLATDSILEKMATTPASAFANSSKVNTNDSIIIKMLADKFDAMINLLSNGNDIQDQLLRHSRI